MDNVIKIHPLDMGAKLQEAAKDGGPEILVREDGLIEYPVGGQVYEQMADMPVTSDWGKQVLEDAKYVDLRKG